MTSHMLFHVLSKNVSTINPQMLDMTAIAIKLQMCDASIFLAQETNMAWKPETLTTTHLQCRQVHHHLKIASSSSAEKTDNYYRPSGTLDKWASRVISWGKDELLGWWSYIELVGQHGKRLIIALAY